ncbi:MAG TPA: MFS transporter [Aggregatilinea sp.]|uniref:MFS transporter n=1 Tax=Aggregatilinea sp. TaxID=2806333 RepID=UPI002B68386C|nr:MFS transporter [Aggregatilinea sp.]HML22056.1 MFS transporter [Aggregatilinea sp.]
MSATVFTDSFEGLDDATYQRRKRAWAMYDWANSAFATTVLAAVLPAYYSSVAGANLPSEATATGYWSITLAIGLFIVAILSPILGTVSDIVRGKKKFLSLFVGIGVVGTGLLVLVGTGDWLLASILFVVGRVGFSASLIFYDALLPHVARPDDVDRLSTTGYAIGYLGGGLLLAINIVMIFTLGAEWGARWSFVSVAIWWAVFSIPLFVTVSEPPAATAALGPGESVIRASFTRLGHTFRDLRQYRELFKFLVSFLIYNDGIGTIIGIAVIYGAELGFGTLELVAALLLVQFVGIPFSFVFGRIPYKTERNRAFFLAFILWNLIMLPAVGLVGRAVLSEDLTGASLPDYAAVGAVPGTGEYSPADETIVTRGTVTFTSGEGAPVFEASGADWQATFEPDAEFDDEALTYLSAMEPGTAYQIAYHGTSVKLLYSEGPDRGIFRAYLDGEPYDFDSDDDDLAVGEVNAYRRTVRWNNALTIDAEDAGEHTLLVVNTGATDNDADGTRIDVGRAEILPPPRESNLGLILGLLAAIELGGLALSWTVGKRWVVALADTLNTKRSVLLSIGIYSVIAIWGYFIDSVLEFWLLAWMVAIVQGGSQALSRSLYASMSPRAKSGEFFGFFSVMEKFAGIIGPIIFAAVIAVFGNSRPAVLSLIILFIIGGLLLTRVNVEEGRAIARAEDEALFNSGAVKGGTESPAG